MGMRPQMSLVFGVDDFSGSLGCDIYEARIHAKIGDDESPDEFIKHFFFDRQTDDWHYVYETLYYDSEFSPGILGLEINQTQYDSDLVRALSVFHPEYMLRGKMDIPVWIEEEHPLYTQRLRRLLPTCDDITFQWSWFYPSVIEAHHMWPVFAYCTRWLLRFVGIDIDYRQYKAMLVWQWS